MISVRSTISGNPALFRNYAQGNTSTSGAPPAEANRADDLARQLESRLDQKLTHIRQQISTQSTGSSDGPRRLDILA